MPTINQKGDAAIDRGRSTVYSWLMTCPPSDYNFTHNLNQADAATIQAVLNDLPEKDNKSRITILERRLRKLQKTAPKNETQSVQNETIPAKNEPVSPDSVVAIETRLIDPSEFEPQILRRAKFKDAEIESLGASIVKHRLRQPILVRPRVAGRYEIVFGERRYLASVRKGIETINCFVEDLTDAEVLELQYEENHRRQNKDPLEDAFFFQFLIETEGYTSDRIADRFDWKVEEVRKFLKLNNLIREAKEELSAGILPLKHAVYLASFPEESQRIIVQKQFAYKYHDREEKATSFEHFKADVEANIVRRLSDAPFDPYDARLRWDNLVCADCRERTDAPGQLFPDLKDHAMCLNQYCWDWKSRAHLKFKREAIAARMPNPENAPLAEVVASIPLVTAKPWTDEKTPFVEKVLTNQKLLPEPECEFSEASLIVDGERKGKEAFICRNQSCAIHNRQTAAENNELKKKQDDFDRKVALLTREKVFAEAIKTFDNNTPIWMFDDLINKLLLELWHSCGFDTRKPILRIIKDWKNLPDEGNAEQIKAFLASLDRRQQSQLIFLFVHRTTGFYSNSSTEDVQRIAESYAKRDYARFDAQARYELAPEEFKADAAAYLDALNNGIPAEIPAFWWGFDEEAADACELEVE